MRKISLAAAALLVAVAVVSAQEKETEKKKEKVKEPAKVENLHEAMEGVGGQAKKVGFAFRDKKHDNVEADAGKMVKYISKAMGFDSPELVKTEEDEKEYRDLQKKLKETIQAVAKAAKKKDFKAAKENFKDASKLCGSCHTRFRPEKEEKHKEGK